MFYKVAAPFKFQPAVAEGSDSPQSSPTLVLSVFFITAILAGVRWLVSHCDFDSLNI